MRNISNIIGGSVCDYPCKTWWCIKEHPAVGFCQVVHWPPIRLRSSGRTWDPMFLKLVSIATSSLQFARFVLENIYCRGFPLSPRSFAKVPHTKKNKIWMLALKGQQRQHGLFRGASEMLIKLTSSSKAREMCDRGFWWFSDFYIEHLMI